MIAEPPVFCGVFQLSVTWPLPEFALRSIEEIGTVTPGGAIRTSSVVASFGLLSRDDVTLSAGTVIVSV